MLTTPNRGQRQIDDGTVSQSALDLLYAIGEWYNGAEFHRDGQLLSIATSQPPKLQTLIDCGDNFWDYRYADAFDELESLGWVRGSEDPEWILSKPVKWAPTRQGRAAIGDFFREEFIEKYKGIIRSDGGLVGYLDETLTHRTGVELCHFAGGHPISAIGDFKDHPWENIVMYPGNRRHTRPDVGTANEWTSWEIITSHDDLVETAEKLMRIRGQYEYVRWLFDTRETAFRVLSFFHESDLTDIQIVNAPYDNSENYSLQTGRDFLKRSREDDRYCVNGIDQLETLQSLWDQKEHFAQTYNQKPPIESTL
ncbi:hypothetical protein [Halorubrum sp. CSM-61]|uniref:hypothetical protein n=1 Tax=Halorubrum sp. CSM-61 TaxID=2485838 RepID=UPI000F4B3F21|nr:hypothetical protein [Halorubrum sp. CSM-61]